jgi:hypothetical protein
VTGHGWTVAAMHRRSLEHFDFDSVLLPWNWSCAHHPPYAADFEATVALCEQRNVAVQTIKALARGPWAAGSARNRETWYQPLEDEADIRAADSRRRPSSRTASDEPIPSELKQPEQPLPASCEEQYQRFS